MYTTDKIAILMATYNGEKFINEQIDSLINQTNMDWELYVRDDMSSDKTVAIVNEYCSRYSNIHLVHDDLGGLGPRDNFLRLMKVVDAPYYMFCDQDDVWFTDKISKTFELLKHVEHTNPVAPILIGSDCTTCDADLHPIFRSHWEHLRINPHKFLKKKAVSVYPFITGASMIFNRQARDLCFPFPDNMPPNKPMYDWWICLRVIDKGVVKILDEPTRFYRQHSCNVSGGIDKLDSSYIRKFRNILSVYKHNQERANVFCKLHLGTTFKYYMLKFWFLLKMLSYNKH